jgi:hypothetical protein
MAKLVEKYKDEKEAGEAHRKVLAADVIDGINKVSELDERVTVQSRLISELEIDKEQRDQRISLLVQDLENAEAQVRKLS